MPFFSRHIWQPQQSQPQPTSTRKARRPEGVSRRRKRELGFETLEDRRVMSAQSPLAVLRGQIADGVSIQATSYSSNTAEGRLQIMANELYWQSLLSAMTQGQMNTNAIPTDPLLNNQWHLINSGQSVGNPDFQPIFAIPGEDINVGPVWNQGIFGNGVVVAVLDSGVQTAHPDLIANLHPTLEFDAIDNDADANPNLANFINAHGTSVAGLIGATANNGQGGTGVAPGVQLVPIRLIDAGQTEQAFIDAFRFALDNGVDITNNSWSPTVTRGIAGPTAAQLLALRDSIFFGRDGKGVIHVFSSGNDAGAPFNEGFGSMGSWDSSTYNGWVSSRYTVGVTGVDHDGFYNNADGTVFSYAEASAGVLIAAPTGSNGRGVNIANDTGLGSGVWTTDTLGDTGFNETGFIDDRDFFTNTDYTSRFNGTSTSAPLVSGVIALMLEANPNLTWRDVQEILVRSARQNAEFGIPETASTGPTQNTWIVNQTPVFHDPDIFQAGIDPDLQTLRPTLDPTLRDPFNGLHYAPTPQVLTNGAGYTVSQGKGAYGEMIGYAHGVVDAELAVQLAQQWSTKNQMLSNELTWTTAIAPVGGFFINLPAREQGNQESGFQIVPGGIGGTVGGGFIDYWNEYYADTPPGPFADFDDDDVRGGFIEFAVPGSNTMSIETIEVKINATGGNTQFLDNVRVLLISPDGTHHELNHYFQEDPGVVTLPQNFQDQPQMQFREGGALISTDTNPGGAFLATFSTKRGWGERSDTKIIFDPTTAEPASGALLPQGWQLHMENYSGTQFQLNGIEIAFHGSPVAANTFRLQGLVGVDDNQDNDFNYSRVVQASVNIDNDASTLRFGEVVNIIDTTHESMAANVTVVARRASDGVIVDQFVTGADGNYYFDLVPDDYILSVEDPLGRAAIEDTLANPNILQHYRTEWTITSDFFKVWEYDNNLEVAVDANGVPLSFGGVTTPYHVKDINFLLDPGPPVAQQVNFSGVVNADFNGDGLSNGNDVAVPGARVYADTNRNGAIDAGEIFVTTNSSGQYNLVVPNSSATVINVGVVAPPNWSFSDPTSGFEPLFVEPGNVFTGIDFNLTPPLGTSAGNGSSQAGYLMGVVYEDANNNSSRQSNELGVQGLQVYVDTNNNGTREVNEPTTTTNANGAYIFANIAPGIHRVRAVPVAPLLSINPGPGVPRIVTLAGGGTVSQIEFGVGLGSNPTANFDFGDLPPAYGITTSAENGARHARSAYYLGVAGVTSDFDVDTDGKPSADAGKAGTSGDDQIGADEDGILVDPLVKGAMGHLVATASRNGGSLQGWIDFNGDNVFQASEKVISNVALVTGPNDVYFQIPADFTDGNIFARFRYGEFGINSVTGAAVIGEVEDYMLDKDPSALPAVIEHGPDFNEDGDIDGRDFLTWQRNHGATNASPSQGDANSDGTVGYADLVQWRNFYGTTSGGLSAITTDDGSEDETAGNAELANQVTTLIDEVEEESTFVEALLIVDTYDSATLTSVTEASAQSSTLRSASQQQSVAAELLFATSDDSQEEVAAVTVDAEDLDSAFEDSAGLVNLGVILRDSSRERYAAARYLRDADSEDDNAFELAFAEEADWRQF